MQEVIQRVLEKLVLPTNDRLVGVKVRRVAGYSENDYMITYLINDRIDFKDSWEISNETRTMVNMILPHPDKHYMIEYRMVEDK